jgi:hypothetical protein
MPYQLPDFERCLQIALNHSQRKRTTPLTRDQAARAVILGLESILSANAANVNHAAKLPESPPSLTTLFISESV